MELNTKKKMVYCSKIYKFQQFDYSCRRKIFSFLKIGVNNKLTIVQMTLLAQAPIRPLTIFYTEIIDYIEK